MVSLSGFPLSGRSSLPLHSFVKGAREEKLVFIFNDRRKRMTPLLTDSTLTPQYSALLSVPELSAYLGIKSKTLYAKIEAGEIPHYRIGRLVRFRLDEINIWLEGCRKHIHQAPEQVRVRKRRKSSLESKGQVSAVVAKAIDEQRDKYYASDHGKSDRIEGLGKEADSGNI
jgi:excisionase family DNA binding protein